MFSDVYQIIHNNSDKRYIGSSKNISSRIKDHKRTLYSGSKHHSVLLQRSW